MAPKKSETTETENAAGDTGATTSEKALATVIAKGEIVLANGLKIKVGKQVSLQVLPQKDGETRFVKFIDKIYQGEELKDDKRADKMAAAMLAKVTNLETMRDNLLIVNKVMEGEIDKTYPGASYVGKSFAITMNPKAAGKRYKTFDIWELEVTGETA